MAKFYTKESKYHALVKENVYDWLVNKNIPLADQRGIVNHGIIQFGAMESPVDGSNGFCVPYHNFGSCSWCFPDSNNMSESDEDSKNYELIEVWNQRNKIIDEENLQYFKKHPCHECKFNDYSWQFYFDIAFARKGSYLFAIEIVHTSKVKSNKIQYCKENDIALYEIKAIDYYAYSGVPEQINCLRLA